jgi:hypothetical protein
MCLTGYACLACTDETWESFAEPQGVWTKAQSNQLSSPHRQKHALSRAFFTDILKDNVAENTVSLLLCNPKV